MPTPSWDPSSVTGRPSIVASSISNGLHCRWHSKNDPCLGSRRFCRLSVCPWRVSSLFFYHKLDFLGTTKKHISRTREKAESKMRIRSQQRLTTLTLTLIKLTSTRYSGLVLQILSSPLCVGKRPSQLQQRCVSFPTCGRNVFLQTNGRSPMIFGIRLCIRAILT